MVGNTATFAAMMAVSLPYLTVSSNIMAASDSRVTWMSGRYTRESDGSVSFDWEGVSARVAMSGGSYVTMLVNSTEDGPTRFRTWQFNQDYFFPETTQWIVPGVQTIMLAVGEGEVAIANNVAPQYYSSAQGRVYVVSFATDGVFTQASTPPRAIEFVGDSITAATNVVNPAQIKCADGGYQSDWGISWSSQLCGKFDAQCSTIAVGGKGLVRNCCDNGELMPGYYQQTNYQPNGVFTYNFSNGFTPDAVVIYLGTNDYSAGGSPTLDAAFTAGYLAFMQNITRWYKAPNITFFCTAGPMSPVLPVNATLAAVVQAKSMGLNAHYLDITSAFAWNNGTNDGCAGHPGIISHSIMANLAEPQIAQVMGW
jgi:lysophospholipase L1-like esterase